MMSRITNDGNKKYIEAYLTSRVLDSAQDGNKIFNTQRLLFSIRNPFVTPDRLEFSVLPIKIGLPASGLIQGWLRCQ